MNVAITLIFFSSCAWRFQTSKIDMMTMQTSVSMSRAQMISHRRRWGQVVSSLR